MKRKHTYSCERLKQSQCVNKLNEKKKTSYDTNTRIDEEKFKLYNSIFLKFQGVIKQ